MSCVALDPVGASGFFITPLEPSSLALPLLGWQTPVGFNWKGDSEGLIPVGAQAVLESCKGYSFWQRSWSRLVCVLPRQPKGKERLKSFDSKRRDGHRAATLTARLSDVT